MADQQSAVKTFNKFEIEKCLETLAKIHTQSLINFDIATKRNSWSDIELNTADFLKKYVKLVPQQNISANDFEKKLSNFMENFNQDVRYVSGHGNLIKENILFRDGDCRFVNTKTTYKPPLFDVIFLIIEVVDDVSETQLSYFILHYRNALVKELENLNLNLWDYIPVYQLTPRYICSDIKFLMLLHKVGKLVETIKPIKNNPDLQENIEEIVSILLKPKISEETIFRVVSEKIHTDEFEILDYREEKSLERNGYLGEHSKLEVTVQHGETRKHLSFFVKSQPEMQSQKEFILELGGYFKECQFFCAYHTLLKKNGINILDNVIPKCYLPSEEIFIFENLEVQGYKTFDARTPLEIDVIKHGLSSMAKLHASGLILENVKNFKLNEKFPLEFQEAFYSGKKSSLKGMGSCKHGFRAVIDLSYTKDMNISKEEFTEKILKCCDSQNIFAAPSSKFRNTICHADPWTKNFLFRFGKNGKALNCVIVDFQTYRYSPPAQDVMAFLYLVTDRSLRTKHMDELLNFYYKELNDSLTSFGQRDWITREEFFQSCRYYKQFALIQNGTHFLTVLFSPEASKEVFANLENAKKIMFENRYDFTTELCLKDSVYKDRLFECIADLKEFYKNLG